MIHMDEMTHLIKLLSAQQDTTYPQAAKGYIATYDPKLHRVKVIIPSLRGDDDTPVLSPWIPLGSAVASNGWGMQWVPKGGATLQNPTAGEQVQVGFFDRTIGVAAVACTFYSQTNLPPATNSNVTLGPGDQILLSPEGSFIHLLNSGDIDVSTTQAGNVNVKSAQGTVSLTDGFGSNLTLDNEGNALLKANLKVTGSISATEDIVAQSASQSVSLTNHLTSGVESGDLESGPPVPGT
jgi:uncharacterized protein involved in type VI secretion and phage assembly